MAGQARSPMCTFPSSLQHSLPKGVNMRRAILNIAFATVAVLGASAMAPATAKAAAFATCTEGTIIVTGTTCTIVNGHCACTD